MTLVFPEEAVIVRVWLSLAAPEPIPARLTVCKPAFSLMDRLAMVLRVGAWFTELTVTVKDWVTILLLAPPSLTVTVMVAVPLALATGVKESEPVVAGLV